jgi:hypothetical protein
MDITQIMSGESSIASSFDIQEVDTNKDGKAESIQVSIELQRINPKSIRSVLIAQTLKYGIDEVVDADIKFPLYNIF